MILSLEKLRADYKSYRKKDPFIAEKLDILISITKFELLPGAIHSARPRQHNVHVLLQSIFELSPAVFGDHEGTRSDFV